MVWSVVLGSSECHFECLEGRNSQSEGMRQAFLDVTCADFGVVQIRTGSRDVVYRAECQGCTRGWRSCTEVVGT